MKNPSLELNNVLSTKLGKLLSFLRWSTEEFEKVVHKITDKNLKQAINAVILETNQYEREVNAHLQCMNPTGAETEHVTEGVNQSAASVDNCLDQGASTDKQLIELFCKQEVHFEKEYRKILNEYFPYHGLREMLTYQMNGIKCAFMRLKLLRLVKAV